MGEPLLFVLTTLPMGMWLGICERACIEGWKGKDGGINLIDPRSINIVPMDKHGSRYGIQIGSPYLADTKQKSILVKPMSIEILGEITEESGTTICSDHTTLFQNYNDALVQWRAAMSNITVASPSDLSNITQLPGTKRPH